MVDHETQYRVLLEATERIASRLAEETTYLNELDAKLGDSDHGNNVARGFDAAAVDLKELDDPTLDEAVRTVGMSLLGEIGGTSGALYGGALLAASSELEDGLTEESAVSFGLAYLNAIQEKTDTGIGEKTMIDAVTPAVNTLKAHLEQDDSTAEQAATAMVEASQAGSDFTVPLKATRGRASYLEWRSVGHRDPGAASTVLILETLIAVLEDHLKTD